MSRPCSICTHDACSTIDQELVDAISYRDIAQHYGVSKSAVMRHSQQCTPSAVAIPGHLTGQAPAQHQCPCTHVNWHALAREAQQLCEGMRDRRDPYVAVEALKLTLALLAKLTESACAPYRAP